MLLIEIDREEIQRHDTEMYSQMAQAYYKLDQDDHYRVGVVYANGPHFVRA